MGNAPAGCAWMTVQGHQNIIAVAVLREMAAIVITGGQKPDAETIDKADQEGIPVFDVRKESEYAAEHFENVVSTPLSLLNDHLAEFPKETTFYLHCAGGYRSVIAASILKSRGIHNLVDVSGGFTDMKKAGLPTTNYVCPSTKRS